MTSTVNAASKSTAENRSHAAPASVSSTAAAVPTDMDTADDKARLRSEMRARRSALTTQALAEASASLVRRLSAVPVLAKARRIAAYRAVRGEITLDTLIDSERWATFTLPRVIGTNLEFVARCEGQSFSTGSFGIPEPTDGAVVPFAEHDVVLVPLVAFDENCYRLGQGGGFYDRAVASLPAAGTGTGLRPVLIGVAHWFQQVERVPRQHWDLPLDAVITDRAVIGL